MRNQWFAIPLLALSLGATGIVSAKAQEGPPQGPPPPGYDRDRGGWDAPPGEFREIQRQGFHDGVEGARRDFDHHRAPNVRNREEYRHPHVSGSAREDYREGFRRGYDRAMAHLTGHDYDRDHDHDHDNH